MTQPKLVNQASLRDQHGETFDVWQGLSDEHQQQLLDFSKNDPLITENTSDSTRFASSTKLTEWLSGQRIVYSLAPKANPNELSGLAWFSHEPFPLKVANQSTKNAAWTFAIRLYSSARGKRLSIPFITKAFEYFQQKNLNQTVWLSTRKTNAISKKIYGQFGFQAVAEQDGKIFYVYNNRV